MKIAIYGIDRDNGDGRYIRRHSFRPFTGPVNHHNDLGLITHQDTDAGHVASIEVPDDARMSTDVPNSIRREDPDDPRTREECLVLANGWRLSADDALKTASDRGYLRMGLKLITV